MIFNGRSPSNVVITFTSVDEQTCTNIFEIMKFFIAKVMLSISYVNIYNYIFFLVENKIIRLEKLM